MARIRLAQALARQGHHVTIIAHVTHPHRHRGVSYLPLSQISQKSRTDILIMTSSGGALSLEPALDLKITSKWREVWVHGTPYIKGLDQLLWDCITPVSNFICDVIKKEWPLVNPKQFTIYNGTSKRQKKRLWHISHRNPFRLIYTSHPAKGLASALGVLKKLRAADQRYHLHVYGGDGLYGGKDMPLEKIEGVSYFGTRGQWEVLSALETASVSIHLQSIREGFGMTLTESMLHGAIPIASPVGAFPELLDHGKNDFLIFGDHLSDETQTLAAEWIHRLNQTPAYTNHVRFNAMNIPWTWDTMAKVRTEFWEWAICKKGTFAPQKQGCNQCGYPLLLLADGFHCIGCGRYYHQVSAVGEI